MFALLLTLLIIDALLLSVVVLLQAGQGGGLASLGGSGTETVLGGRQAVTILTKATWWCGGIFLVLSLLLSLVRRGPAGSELQEQLRKAGATAPAPSTGTPAPLQGATPLPPAAQAPAATQPTAPATTPSAPAPTAPAPKK
jgi:preprotein translocase subunit SecG